MENDARTRKVAAIAVAVVVILSFTFLDDYQLDLERPISNIISGRYNDRRYTRGKMHYLSMDSGMEECWNETIKPILQLACPDMTAQSDIELELTFMLTSCFCESIGHPKLGCEDDTESKREGSHNYRADAELILCAQGKCFNEWNFDGFDTIFKRMPDLCYFFEYEAHYHNHEMKKFTPDEQLEQVLAEVKGSYSTNWPELPCLTKLVSTAVMTRKNSIKRIVADEWTEFQLMAGDIKYHIQSSFEKVIEYTWEKWEYYSYLFYGGAEAVGREEYVE